MLTSSEIKHIKHTSTCSLFVTAHGNVENRMSGHKGCSQDTLIELYLYFIAVNTYELGSSYNYIDAEELRNIHTRIREISHE